MVKCDPDQIVLQMLEELRSHNERDINQMQIDLLLIAAIQNPETASKLLAAAALQVRSALYSVDESAEKLHRLAGEIQHD